MGKILPQRVNLADRKVKVGIYGESGTGKTHSMLTFPGIMPLDLEGTVASLLDRPEFSQITSLIKFDPKKPPQEFLTDVASVIEAVYAGDTDYPCQSIGVDSASVLLVKGNEINADRPKNVGEWAARNFRIQKSMDALYGPAPVHVCVIAQQKDEWKQKVGSNSPEKTGRYVPHADNRFPYVFDILVRTFKNDKSDFNFVVEKSRLIHLPAGTVGVNFSYETHVKPALAGGMTEPEIPASLTNEALKATWARAGRPGGQIAAWITSHGFDPKGLSLEDRIALDRKLQDIVKANEDAAAAAARATEPEDAELEQAVAAGF